MKHDVAVTVGCFDIFHHGHENLLKQAYKKAHVVIVVLHDDHSIFVNKKHYPAQNYEHRKNSMQNWASKNKKALTIIKTTHADPTPVLATLEEILKKDTRNAFYFRGDDWLEFPGKEQIIKNGWAIEYFGYTKGISSTELRNNL